MKKVGIMIDDGYHDLELWIPYYRFLENYIDFEILAWEDRKYWGMFGVDPAKPTRLLSQSLDDIELIYMPGAKSPENLMKNVKTLPLVEELYSSGIKFATICHSPLILAKAGLIDGEKITGHPSIAEELSKYNVELAKDPVINSKHVISGKNHYQMHIFLPHFLAR